MCHICFIFINRKVLLLRHQFHLDFLVQVDEPNEKQGKTVGQIFF